MNLRALSNTELHLKTKSKTEQERRLTIEVLWHLREIERRMLYAQMGYRDLKEYCVKELKYSEGSAWLRISAMRLLKEVPEVETKIQTGELNLTQVTMAQSHFREVKATLAEKKEILLELQDQSKISTERILAERKPEGFVELAKETEKAVRGGGFELTLVLDPELLKELEEIQTLLGKRLSKLELFKLMAKQILETLQRKTKRGASNQCKAQPLRSRDESNQKPLKMRQTRYVAADVRRAVQERDQNRCQYRDLVSGRQCEARFHLQIEHRTPFSKGGESQPENLQLLCSNHNRLRAVQQFGARKMNKFVPSLR
jgi:5-methylcytosine-specific restriction endonuclease McrA